MNRIGIGLVVLVVGCSAPPQEGLRITTQDPETFAGALKGVTFRAARAESGIVEVRIALGTVTATVSLDYAAGQGDFDAGDNPFRPADTEALLALTGALGEVLPPDAAQRTAVEEATLRAVSWLSAAPIDTPLPTTRFVAAQGWVHLSCTCSRQYIGSGYYRTAGKGSGCTGGSGNGCKGRCGVGCGPDNLKWPWSWGSGIYTRDCAKHDYGLGSWLSASDDYNFAGYNCG